MLSDNLFFGQSVNKIDSKGRIYLPAHSGREKGETVYVLYDSDVNEYKVVPASVVADEFKKLEGMIDASCNTEMLRECKSRLIEFSASILAECIVDGSGRILLPETLGKDVQVTLIGCGNHFVLRPHKNTEKQK